MHIIELSLKRQYTVFSFAADVIFVTEDKPHETFRREGSNLRMTVDVFLNEALTGIIVTVNTIDDRTLRVPITSVIS